MNTLQKNNENKAVNKRSIDPYDRLIFDKGIRIVILNNSNAFKFSFKHFPKLNQASEKELFSFELKGNGIGIHWDLIDEDLSLKGIIKGALELEALQRLQSKDSSALAIF